MKQQAAKSTSGMFTRFTPTQVVRVADCNNSNLLRVLDSIKPGAVFHADPLAVVDELTAKNGVRFRQTKVLNSVMLSEDLYDDLVAATPALIPFIRVFNVVDDFLLTDDRFSRSLVKLALEQTMKSDVHTVGPGGIVDLGVPYEESTLIVTQTQTMAVAEQTKIQFPAMMAAGTYFNYDVDGTSYYVWADDGVASDPAPGGRTGIAVSTTGISTASQWAFAVSLAMLDVSATVNGDEVTWTNLVEADVPDATAETSGGTITVLVQGQTAATPSITPVLLDGAAGTVEFALGDIGQVATFTFVTKPVYPVMRIKRFVTQASGSAETGPIPNTIFAYVISKALATALGVTLPPI